MEIESARHAGGARDGGGWQGAMYMGLWRGGNPQASIRAPAPARGTGAPAPAPNTTAATPSPVAVPGTGGGPICVPPLALGATTGSELDAAGQAGAWACVVRPLALGWSSRRVRRGTSGFHVVAVVLVVLVGAL